MFTIIFVMFEEKKRQKKDSYLYILHCRVFYFIDCPDFFFFFKAGNKSHTFVEEREKEEGGIVLTNDNF